MDGTIIRLTAPIEAFNRQITTVALREATGALFMRLGEPRIAVVNGDGSGGYFVEQPQVISAYLDRLLSIEGDDDAAVKSVVLAKLSLVDAMALKRALFLGFEAAAATAAAGLSA